MDGQAALLRPDVNGRAAPPATSLARPRPPELNGRAPLQAGDLAASHAGDPAARLTPDVNGQAAPPATSLALLLPPELVDVPYVAARYPGSSAVADRPELAAGANCQLYAYAVLAHFGRRVPPLRSSELWEDRAVGRVVTSAEPPEPLDLLLFGPTAEPYAAHVGVWLGPERILHLCREVGRPAVWSPDDFRARARYRVLIGAKRFAALPVAPAPWSSG